AAPVVAQGHLVEPVARVSTRIVKPLMRIRHLQVVDPRSDLPQVDDADVGRPGNDRQRRRYDLKGRAPGQQGRSPTWTTGPGRVRLEVVDSVGQGAAVGVLERDLVLG